MDSSLVKSQVRLQVYCTMSAPTVQQKATVVYMCSLDAQGAFGAIPIPVLLHKAMNVLPDSCWQTLYYWYHNMSVQIHWTNQLGKIIHRSKKGDQRGRIIHPIFVQPVL